MTHSITFDQVGCARCDSEGHPGMTFQPFTFPVVLSDEEGAEPTFTHWALCPTNGEPLLLATIFDDHPNELDSTLAGRIVALSAAAARLRDELRFALCRRGWHRFSDPLGVPNCDRCGYRWHGNHCGEYARWKLEGRVP